ncbi:uncharacterized protein LOC134770729 [Penaeus indicus]|uniref:uncharacterized protein LOC134770729 n=1 Tax=Penaeus indicus TaxID=29960 RepID=UPI00300CE917
MKLLVFISAVVAASSAAPQGYDISKPSGPGFSFGSGGFSGSNGGGGSPSGSGYSNGGGSSSSSSGYSNGGGGSSGGCKEGEILHVDGTCVVPEITRNVFLYDAPQQSPNTVTPPDIPPPKVDYNIIFVRLPEGGAGPEPIIIPPPRQENIVYVLNKNGGGGAQRVIEVTTPPPSNPEVYFVNYGEGENPTLPIGVDLQTALNAATEASGQVVGGAAGGQGGSGTVGGTNGYARSGNNGGKSGFGGSGGFVRGNSGSRGSGFGASGGGSSGGQYSTPVSTATTPSRQYSGP